MMAQRPRGRFWQFVGFAAVLAIIALSFALFVDLQAVVRQLEAADLRFLTLAVILLVAGLLAYANRWRLLLASKPSFALTFHAANIGHAANILIPARAGEAIRLVTISRDEAVSLAEAGASFVVERLFEQVMRLFALFGAVAFGAGIKLTAATYVGGSGILLLAFGGILWLVKHSDVALGKIPPAVAHLPRVNEEKVRRSLADMLKNLSAVSSPRQLALIMLWSLIPWICFWAFYLIALFALRDGLPSNERLPVSLGALALSPPSAPTQPGIFHASVVAPLAAVGYDAEVLTAYAVIIHILEMLCMIGLALWGLGSLRLSVAGLLKR